MDFTSILLIAAAVAGVAYFVLQPDPKVNGPIDTAVDMVTGVASAIGSGVKNIGKSIVDGGVSITSKVARLPAVSLVTTNAGIIFKDPEQWLSPRGATTKTVRLVSNTTSKINPMNWF